MNTQLLRRTIRARRRQLTQQTLQAHSRLMACNATSYRPLQHSKRIAFYFATNGEMDPLSLIDRARAAGKHCYFPVLRERPSKSLWFAELKTGQAMKPNRFGIPEPAEHHKHITMPWGLDLIILPLVAFDLAGNRLGMGGGFYDRTLSFKLTRSHWRGPKLIGLAHEFQMVRRLPAQPWDIPLDAVITEKQLYRFK